LTRFPARATYLTLALACLLFAAYGSLLPFEFEWTSFDIAWRRFHATILYNRPRRTSRSDVLANVLLFVPIGFALAGALLVDRQVRWRVARAAVLILPFSVATSIVIEFVQVFAPGRIPSSADIAAQTTGCFFGICLWVVVGDRLAAWLRETFASAPEGRLPRLLTAYAFGWIFINLAPFDITVDAGDLAARVNAGRIALLPFTEPDLLSPAWIRDAGAELLGAIPLGAFGVLTWKSGVWRRPGSAFVLALLIVCAVEAAQVFVRSHSARSTDAIFAGGGILLGVAASYRFLPRDGVIVPPAGRLVNRFALVGAALWILVVCAYHWAPYDFSVDTDVIRRKLGRISFLPFAGYRSGSYLGALNNLLTKLSLAIPFGLIASFVVHPGRFGRSTILAGWLGAGLMIFGTVEFGQFFLPRRVPDPTDVLVASAGVYIGLRSGLWLLARRRGQKDPGPGDF